MAMRPLSKLPDYRVVDKDQDVRGWPVRDAAGNEMGKVTDLMVDTDRGRAFALMLEDGQQLLVEGVDLGDRVVIFGGPAGTAGASGAEGDLRLQAVEESLQVGKREVDQGGVRVSTAVSERPVEAQVRLREEIVEVERRPVDRPLPGGAPPDLEGRAVELRERAEVPVVAKEARVVEEVVVRKDVGERVETVRDSVRRQDIRVEDLRREDPGRRPKQ